MSNVCNRVSRARRPVVRPLLKAGHAALLLAAMAAAPAAAQPTIANLDVLPGGAASYAYALSADGLVVTGTSGSGAGYRAFRWTAGTGMQSLGVVSGFVSSSTGTGISSDGAVVTGVSSAAGGSISRGFRWTAATGMQSIGVLGSGSASYANAISGDGSIITGGSYDAGFNGATAIRWTTGGGIQRLVPAPAAIAAVGFAISADGAVIAGTEFVDGYARAFRWSAGGGLQDLSILTGADSAEAHAISADGSVIAGFSGDQLNATFQHAARWIGPPGSGGAVQDLGVLDDGDFSYAGAISANGSVVVGFSTLPGGDDHAFLWTASLGMVDLNTYLPIRGVDLTGWVLNAARGISADGSTVVGGGRFNGADRAFIVRGLNVACPSICTADFNCSGGVSLQDILDFLAAYFSNDPRADFNGSGAISVQDIFDFLAEYFAGCL